MVVSYKYGSVWGCLLKMKMQKKKLFLLVLLLLPKHASPTTACFADEGNCCCYPFTIFGKKGRIQAY